MDEFPDPDDEYDIHYKNEFEFIEDIDNNTIVADYIRRKSKQSLNFDDKLKEPPVSIKRVSSEIDEVDLIYPPLKKIKTATEVEFEYLGVDILDPTPSVSLVPDPQMSIKNINGVTSYKLPTWNFITVNSDYNERLFVRLRQKEIKTADIAIITESKGVSKSFMHLKQEVIKNLSIKKPVLDPFENYNTISVIESSDLWAEQFKPKNYLELLSDEGVNRSLLYWIKTWDKLVFKTENPIKKLTNSRTMKPGQFKTKFQIQEEKALELDEDGRPHNKLALLCGPPGIGKTTLATVIAKVAGYNVIEVNASDDRSIDSFRTILQNATEMQPVMGSKKPNCVVLDEIDGAPAASIDFLIKYISGKVVEKSKRGKKEKAKKTIKRPVICICNEPYTPALRQLRQQAYVLNFPNTSTTKLAQRLMEICRHQGMKTDLSTLALLCDKAQSDIRSCITTLNFFQTKRNKVLKASDVSKATVGLKDMQKSLFNIWQAIFQKPTKRALSKNYNASRESVEYLTDCNPENMKRMKKIIELLSASGDYEKLEHGVHDNMLKIQFPWFRKSLLKGLEWFCWNDQLNSAIRRDQSFILMPYLPYAFVSWHFLFSTTSWPKITYPSTGYENHLKSVKYNELVGEVLRGLSVRMRAHSHRTHMLLDVLPLLPQIITPHFRSANATLFNQREKADFKNVVNILLDFNMNFVQQRSADGDYFYLINPGFEEVVQFPIKPRLNTNELTYHLKHMISREVELERLRRCDEILNKSAVLPAASANPNETEVPRHLQKLKPKPLPEIHTRTVQYRDFFGRIVQVERSDAARYGLDKSNYVKSRVCFCFQEGVNNAVKKELTISSLL